MFEHRHHCLATKGDLPKKTRKRNKDIMRLYNDDRNILLLTESEHMAGCGKMGHISKQRAHQIYIERFGRDQAEQYLNELNQHLTIKLRLRA